MELKYYSSYYSSMLTHDNYLEITYCYKIHQSFLTSFISEGLFLEFEFEFVNSRRVLSAKDNNGSKSWNLYIQSSKGVTIDAWKYAIKCV